MKIKYVIRLYSGGEKIAVFETDEYFIWPDGSLRFSIKGKEMAISGTWMVEET